MQDEPTPTELLNAVAAFLRNEIARSVLSIKLHCFVRI